MVYNNYNKAKIYFFKHFIKNENIADHDVLIKIASSLGLDENEIAEMLNKKLDIEKAKVCGILHDLAKEMKKQEL